MDNRAGAPGPGAQWEGIRVLSSGAATVLLPRIVPEFERTSGHRIAVIFRSSNRIMSRIREGETADVVIVNGPAIDQLTEQGKILAGSRADLARTGLGIAVRKGAAKPDIGSAEALKRALLGARSVVHTATGASGVYFAQLIERMGIAAALKPKIKVLSGGLVGEVVARGEAELGVQMVSEILAVPGVELVGPLPPELQHTSVLSAAVFRDSPRPGAAQALVRFLTTPAAARIMLDSGLEPLI